MRCKPDQHDLRYVWEKRNDNLPSRAQSVQSATLTIINLKPEDSGEYRCVVSNSTGRIASGYLPVTIKGIVSLLHASCFDLVIYIGHVIKLNL